MSILQTITVWTIDEIKKKKYKHGGNVKTSKYRCMYVQTIDEIERKYKRRPLVSPSNYYHCMNYRWNKKVCI